MASKSTEVETHGAATSTATTDGVMKDIFPSNEDEVVDWDGPDDMANPVNWSPFRKGIIIALVSITTFNVSMSSTILAPSIPSVLTELHVSDSGGELGPLLVSIYIIGLAVGPLLLAPLSEHYGRLRPSHVANVIFTLAALLASVAVDYPMLLVARLIMGFACCIPSTVGGGYIADLIEPKNRGRVLGLWIIGPALGPVVAPLIGGYLALDTSWRWTQGLIAIISGVITVASGFLLQETYAPYLLDHKARALRRAAPGSNYRSKYDKGQTRMTLFKIALLRPAKMLLRSPIVLTLAVFVSVVYSYTYLLVTTFTPVFQKVYGFDLGEAGLAYLGLGFGLVFGQLSLGPWSDFYLHKRKLATRVSARPEDRLPPTVLGSVFVCVGLLWYGWSAEFRVQWMVPIIGTTFCGVGISCVLLPVQAYLVDAFGIYAASALGANIVVRSIFGACVPLAGPVLYARLGLGWGNTLLALLCMAFAPVALLIWKKGEMIRKSSAALRL